MKPIGNRICFLHWSTFWKRRPIFENFLSRYESKTASRY